MMLHKQFFIAFLTLIVLSVYLQFAAASTIDRVHIVDLSDLIRREGEFEGETVEVKGTVKYYFSFFMHEDFWLEDEEGAKIPVEVRQNDLPLPPENATIYVKGKLVYHDFEGGFYSIHAESWKEFNALVANAVPF